MQTSWPSINKEEKKSWMDWVLYDTYLSFCSRREDRKEVKREGGRKRKTKKKVCEGKQSKYTHTHTHIHITREMYEQRRERKERRKEKGEREEKGHYRFNGR